MSRRRVIRRAHPRGASGGARRAPWPTWDAADGTMGLRTGANGWPAFDAVIGGWLVAAVWFAANTLGAARYIIADGAGSARGWALYKNAAGALVWRVSSAAGAPVDLVMSAPVLNAFNVVLLELDVGAGLLAATMNNGARTTQAIVGHAPTDATDRFAVDNRQTLSAGIGADGGVHAVAGAGSDVITATQRVAFWGSAARARGLADYGQPPGGVETLGNPAAQHKWVAHDLACKVAGTLLTKSGTVVDAYHPPVLAW